MSHTCKYSQNNHTDVVFVLRENGDFVREDFAYKIMILLKLSTNIAKLSYEHLVNFSDLFAVTEKAVNESSFLEIWLHLDTACVWKKVRNNEMNVITVDSWPAGLLQTQLSRATVKSCANNLARVNWGHVESWTGHLYILYELYSSEFYLYSAKSQQMSSQDTSMIQPIQAN